MTSNATENFFQRWARRKAENEPATVVERDSSRVGSPTPAPALSAVQAPKTAPTPAPTLADVGLLAPDADFSRYLASGLDPTVRRAAMKKLFTDPHFNCMDGLDIYIDDYTKPSPVSATMLAGLAHARSTLNPRPAWIAEEITENPCAEVDVADRTASVDDGSDGSNGSNGAVRVAQAGESEVGNPVADQHADIEHNGDGQNTTADGTAGDIDHETIAPPLASFTRALPGVRALNPVHDH